MLEVPNVSVDAVQPVAGQPGWHRWTIRVHNPTRHRLAIDRIDLVKPAGAALLPLSAGQTQSPNARNFEGIHDNWYRAEPSPSRARKSPSPPLPLDRATPSLPIGISARHATLEPRYQLVGFYLYSADARTAQMTVHVRLQAGTPKPFELRVAPYRRRFWQRWPTLGKGGARSHDPTDSGHG